MLFSSSEEEVLKVNHWDQSISCIHCHPVSTICVNDKFSYTTRMSSREEINDKRCDVSTLYRVTLGLPTKWHLNGVSLVDPWWPNFGKMLFSSPEQEVLKVNHWDQSVSSIHGHPVSTICVND